MKRQTQTVGVRKWAGDDLVELQSEPLKALDAFFAEYGPCVIQGCEITISADDSGTFDVAPGLVALEADDQQGGQRVMVMPFAGATGVALPLYLTASVETVSEPYGDGKVKPVAYAYTAAAVGADPGAEVPHLTLTADGGNRFVDAVQDPAHRFISDTERTRWNGILAQAKAYADTVSATGSAAALRSAKEYTDAREVAILASADAKDADTLKTAKAYADKIVAALAGSAPETLDTLQELATALGDDPNFSATVMQMIGERVTTEALNTALAGKVNKAGDVMTGRLIVRNDNNGYVGAAIEGADGFGFLRLGNMSGGSGNKGKITGPFNVSLDSLDIDCANDKLTTNGKRLWHEGNFDPTSKADVNKLAGAILGKGIGQDVQLDVTEVGTGFQYGKAGSGVIGPFITFGHSGYLVQITTNTSTWQNGHFNIKYRVRNGDTGTWSDWLTFYHSGNLDPAKMMCETNSTATDLNDVMTTGVCKFYPTTSNRPPHTYGTVMTIRDGGATWITQLGCCTEGRGMYYRSKSDSRPWTEWKRIYLEGDLGPATASVAGLMSAADKQKLDNIPTGGMKLLGAGVVEADGGVKNKTGLIASIVKSGTGLYRIYHGIGNTNYEVMATGIVSNNNRGYPVLAAKTSGYFDIRTADDSSDNDAGFFFQVFEF